MRSKITFLDNEVKIVPVKRPFTLLVLGGALLLVLGVLMCLRVIATPVSQLIVGVGLIVLSVGSFALFNRDTVIFSVNSSKGIIEIRERVGLQLESTAFPITWFSRILVQKMPEDQSSPLVYRYEILLANTGVSRLLLTDFATNEEALGFAERLQGILMLDLYLNGKVHKKAEFKLKSNNVPDQIRLPEISHLSTIQKESEIVIRWRKHYHLFSYGALALLFYGFFHLIVFGLFPGGLFARSQMAFYIVLGSFTAVALCLLGVRMSSSKNVALGRDALKFYHKFLQWKPDQMTMNWDDVGYIGNSLDISRHHLLILSKEGGEIREELIESLGQKKRPSDSGILDKLKLLAQYQIEVDVKSLPVADRIRIEQEIQNFML